MGHERTLDSSLESHGPMARKLLRPAASSRATRRPDLKTRGEKATEVGGWGCFRGSRPLNHLLDRTSSDPNVARLAPDPTLVSCPFQVAQEPDLPKKKMAAMGSARMRGSGR